MWVISQTGPWRQSNGSAASRWSPISSYKKTLVWLAEGGVGVNKSFLEPSLVRLMLTFIHFGCFRLVLLFMMIYSVFWARSAILVGKIQQEWGKLEKVGDITYFLLTSLQPSRRENMKTRQYLANKLSFSFAFNMNFLPWETKLPPIPSLVMTLPISYKNTVTDLLERVLFKTCVN